MKQIKTCSENKTGTILRLNKKNFEDEELPHELFQTTRQTTEIRNACANNMSTDIKLSKAQISKTIQSVRYFGSRLGILGKKALTNNLPGVVSNLTSNVINKLERKISGKGAVRAGKRFILFISNGDMNDIIKIIKSLEYSGVLIDGVSETVNDEIKRTRRWISWNIVSTFNRFISATINFFSSNSKRYKWKRSSKSRKRIYK